MQDRRLNQPEREPIRNPFPISQRSTEVAFQEVWRRMIDSGSFDSLNEELAIINKDTALVAALDELSRIRTGTSMQLITVKGIEDSDERLPYARMYRVGAAITHRALREEANSRGGELEMIDSEALERYIGGVFHLKSSDIRNMTYDPIASLLPLGELMMGLRERLADFRAQEPDFAPPIMGTVGKKLEFLHVLHGAVDIYGLYKITGQLAQAAA